jgi:hypothetical protein
MNALLELLYFLGWMDLVDRVSKGRPWLWWVLAFAPLWVLTLLILAWWRWFA